MIEPIEFGRYTLIRLIAKGGMAQIFLAVQRGPHGFEKVAVLKVILPELCNNDDFVRMFLDEARIAANLDHNNVVRVYDFGEIKGQYFIAMEHLPGEDLASILQGQRRLNQQMPPDVAADIIAGAATGLHFAHELKDTRGKLMNVVHRDVSPSNIIVTYHGTVKLVDFGIARAETNITKTEAGTLKGKVAYVSPEQAQGEPLDRRSDIWALGTVLYELVTGTRVFRRDSDLRTLEAVARGDFPRPREVRPDIPEELERIILKAMTRPLDQRYQTASEMSDDLARFLMTRSFVRSERHLAEFMSTVFDAERRDAKLLISQAAAVDGGPVLATPSQLKHLPQHLSPLRSHPTLPAVETLAPELPEEPPTTIDGPGAQPQPNRSSRTVAVIAGGVVLIAAGITFGILRPFGAADVVTPPPPTPIVVQKGEPPVPAAVPAPVPAPAPVANVAPTPVPAATPEVPKAKAAPVVAPKAVAKGKLTLDTSPWSEVFLNGRKLGDTPLVDYPMPVGLHVLKLVNDDKGLKGTIEVEIQAGKTTMKRLKL